jgi:predicted AlkP superfamily pyrophosphatase or phosphodiesterase
MLSPILALLFAFFLPFPCAGSLPEHQGSSFPTPEPTAGAPKPRLVVFLVVDQLRGDLLTRYYEVFSGGLKRLMDEGVSFSNALHAHAHTETSPGHAALSTAVYPARAGIPSNVWREGDGSDQHPVYNVVDPESSLVGVPGLPGASPGVLRREGLADWILEEDPDAKVVSISAKDRAAVLMAGKTRGDVYWFNSQVGRFVTSTFYRTENPSWLDEFNLEVMPGFRADSLWASTIPDGAEELSSPDTASFEGDGVNTFFPHRYYQERIDPGMDDFFLWFEGTPMLDRATLMLAEVAVKETGAGQQEGRTDFLSVSLSQTDRIGHPYGPLSREQMDNLLRLDRVLGGFLTFLDDRVGHGNYVLGLTGDHGVMTAPERLSSGGERLTLEHRSLLEEALGKAAREAGRDANISLASGMVRELAEMPFVGPAYTHETLLSGEELDSLGVLFQHALVPGRPGGLLSVYGVEMWWAENTVDWTIATGTTHGSPFYYDRWVPLILVGPGIVGGVEESPVRPMDLAPTLAWLAGIPFPDDLDGRPLPVGGS